MNWKIIAYVSLFGMVMGDFSVFELTTEIEIFFWIVIALISALFIARMTNQKHFLHGYFAGIGIALTFSVVQIIFSGIIVNTQFHESIRINISSVTVSPAVLMLLLSPIIGSVYGIVTGVASLYAGKFHKPK